MARIMQINASQLKFFGYEMVKTGSETLIWTLSQTEQNTEAFNLSREFMYR